MTIVIYVVTLRFLGWKPKYKVLTSSLSFKVCQPSGEAKTDVVTVTKNTMNPVPVSVPIFFFSDITKFFFG